jgi:SAM-dependent methyltransferase
VRFITFRRYYLDNLLINTKFYGKVLDVGGKKDNKRGLFRPPLDRVGGWEYLNIDASTNPDYCCSAEQTPIDDDEFDVVLMTEVLEHLENPSKVLQEVYRVVKKSGGLIATMPFLYPIHADPYDYQRWTPEKIKIELEKVGFTVEKILPMGGVFSVIYDLIYVSLGAASKNERSLRNRIVVKFFMPIIARLFMKLDIHYNYKSNKITTGYFIQAVKH